MVERSLVDRPPGRLELKGQKLVEGSPPDRR
jgi:hypothetical protein